MSQDRYTGLTTAQEREMDDFAGQLDKLRNYKLFNTKTDAPESGQLNMENEISDFPENVDSINSDLRVDGWALEYREY